MRSQDVLHSAYFPHFRAQMNCVPGMETWFHFKPTITTAEMRKITNNPKFDYMLICNKICGASHYNMGMKIVVGTKKEYEDFMLRHKPAFDGKTPPTGAETVAN
jgi:cytochrome c oxidase subunit 2